MKSILKPDESVAAGNVVAVLYPVVSERSRPFPALVVL